MCGGGLNQELGPCKLAGLVCKDQGRGGPEKLLGGWISKPSREVPHHGGGRREKLYRQGYWQAPVSQDVKAKAQTQREEAGALCGGDRYTE